MQRQSLTTSHQQTDVSEQMTTWEKQPCSFTAEHDFIRYGVFFPWYGICIWSVRVHCLSCVSSQNFSHLQPTH